jgi:threonine dehydrogenase-like Zn-dependent dehydrogenase
MRALQLQGLGKLVEVESPVPEPRRDELLVRTVATTICTSDLNDIAHNPFGIRLPRVLGHEGMGLVTAVGETAGEFRVGDRIAAHPVIPCRACEACRRGLGHLCSNLGHLGLDRNGTFAEYFCIRGDRARRVPAGMESCSAALLEPVAVCLEALNRGRLQPGDTLLVVGDGPFGILIARLALTCKRRRIILVGRHDFRLQQVPDAITINQKRTPDVLAAVREANDGSGADVAVMAAGTQAALDLSLAGVRARGRVGVQRNRRTRQSGPVSLAHAGTGNSRGVQ